jgi:nitrate/nitrite transport system substrate-binding protein
VREVPDFNVFYRYNVTYPYYSDAIWYLTQMRCWRQIAEPKTDEWFMGIAKKVYWPDIYAVAAKDLIAEGKLDAKDFPNFATETGFKPTQTEFIDSITYYGSK